MADPKCSHLTISTNTVGGMSRCGDCGEILELGTPGDEPKMNLMQFDSFMKHLIGEMLTIIDATQPDREQREATKSLVRQNLHNKANVVADWMVKQTATMGSNFPY